MDKFIEYKGYKAKVSYDDSIKGFSGIVINIKQDIIHFEGKSEEDLKLNFKLVLNDYLKACSKFKSVPEKPTTKQKSLVK